MALPVLIILGIYLTRVSLNDTATREISNCAPIAVIMASPLISSLHPTERFIGLLAVFVPLFILSFILKLGMGDVKLTAAFGFVIGAMPEYVALLSALIAAALINKFIKYQDGIPLAPYICLANLAVYFIGGFYYV